MGNQASRMRRQRVDFSLAFIHFYFIYLFFLGKNSVQSCLNQLGPARIFLNPQLFLSSFKNFHVYTNPKRIRIHCSTQDSSENIGNRACVVKTGRRENLETGGYYLEYSIHVKELGSYLFRHRIKKNIRICRPYDSGFIGYSKFQLWRADSKSCEFVCRIHRIRVDGSRKPKEKVAD